jgi:hypothetical protein
MFQSYQEFDLSTETRGHEGSHAKSILSQTVAMAVVGIVMTILSPVDGNKALRRTAAMLNGYHPQRFTTR